MSQDNPDTEASLFGIITGMLKDTQDQHKRTADGIRDLRIQQWIILVIIIVLAAARDGVRTNFKFRDTELAVSPSSAQR